jgi:hypothetical protein
MTILDSYNHKNSFDIGLIKTINSICIWSWNDFKLNNVEFDIVPD